MNLETLAILTLLLATIPAALILWNLWLLRSPGEPGAETRHQGQPSVSVLIPARNEEGNISEALASVLANRAVDLEVLVLDDDSTDDTANVVQSVAKGDARVKLLTAPPLTPGWCGKQHACHVLAGHATRKWLVFMDADVRLAPNALLRMADFMNESGVALASGVPHQVTGTGFERLLIPLVHFVLLGFLPVWRMRRCTKPAYAAGCGQLFIADAAAYRQVGGHSRIRSTLHDGIKLPRLFRQNGLKTDLFDATDVASCRMYAGAREVLAGLMKNAHEALASPIMIVPMTLMLAVGQVLPWILLTGWVVLSPRAWAIAAVASMVTLLPRLLAAIRFRQSWFGALMHPVAITMFVGIQWAAFLGHALGKPAQWRGRQYASQPGGTSHDAHEPVVAYPGGAV